MIYPTSWIYALFLCLCFCYIAKSENSNTVRNLKQRIVDFKSNLHRTLEGTRIRTKRQLLTSPADSNEEHLRVGSSAPVELPYLSNSNLTFWIPVRHRAENQVLIGTKEGDLALFRIDDINDKSAKSVAFSKGEEVGLKAKAFSYYNEQWFVIMQSSEGRSWIRLYQRIGRGLEGRQVILLDGESDFDLVTMRGMHYLVVVTYQAKTSVGFTSNANLVLFHWTKTQFDEIARRATTGARSVICWVFDGSLYIAVGQEINDKKNIHIGSPIYLYNSRDENRLVLMDVLQTIGPQKVRHFAVSGNHYIVFIGRSDAMIFWWSSSQFLKWQTIKETAGASDVSVLTLNDGEATIVISRREEVLFLTLDSSGYYVVSFTMKLSASMLSLQFMFSGWSYYALALFGSGSSTPHSIWKLGFTKYSFPKESSLDPLLQCLSNVRDVLEERKNELGLVNTDLNRVWLTTKNQSVVADVVIEGQVTSRTHSTVVNVVVVTHKTEIPQYTTEDIFHGIDQITSSTNNVQSEFTKVVLKSTSQAINGKKQFMGSLFVPSLNRDSADQDVSLNGISLSRLADHGLKRIGDQLFLGNVWLNSISTENANVKLLNGLDTKDFLLLNTRQNVTGNVQFSNVDSKDIQLTSGGSINSLSIQTLVTTAGKQQIKELKSFKMLQSNTIDVQGQINGEELDRVKLRIVTKDGERSVGGHLKTNLTLHITGDLFLLGAVNGAMDLSRLAQETVTKRDDQSLRGPFEFNSVSAEAVVIQGLINNINTSNLITLHTNQTIKTKVSFTHPIHFQRDLISNLINNIDLSQEAVLKNSLEAQFATGLKTFSAPMTVDFVDMSEFVTLDTVDPSLFVQDVVKHQEGVVRVNETVFHRAVVLGNLTSLGGINGRDVYDLPDLVWLKSKPQIIEVPVYIRGGFTTEQDLETGIVNTLNLNTDVIHTFGDEIVISEKKFEVNVVVSKNFSLSIGMTVNGADVSTFKSEASLYDRVSGIKVVKFLEVSGKIFTKTVNGLDLAGDIVLPNAFQTIRGSKTLQSQFTTVSGNLKSSSINLYAYNNVDFSKFIAQTVLTANLTSTLLNKRFLKLKAPELSLSNASTVGGVSITELFSRVVTLNTEQHITSDKEFSSDHCFINLITARSLNGLEIVSHSDQVVTVDSTEFIRGQKEFSRNIKSADFFVQNHINRISVESLAENAFSKSKNNFVSQPIFFMNDLDVGKLLTKRLLDDIAWQNLFYLNQDEILTSAWTLVSMDMSKDIFVTGLLNGCDLARLGYHAIYADKKNEQYVIGALNLESLKVIGNVIVKNELNRISIEDVKRQVITLSGDQVLSGNTLLTTGISTLNVNIKDVANLVDLEHIMRDVVRHSVPQSIRGYKTFKNDVSATVFSGSELFLTQLINGIDVLDLNRKTVWKTKESTISGEKSIMSVVSVNVTVKDFLNGVRLPEDVIQTTTSELIDSPIYLMKDVAMNSDLVVHSLVDGTNLKYLLEERVTITTDQELASHLEFLKDFVVFGSTSIDVLNGVILELAVNVNGNFPVEGFKTFYRGLTVSGPMTAVFVNGYNINSLAHNTLKLGSNEMVAGVQYFSKPVLLQSSLLASLINSISTDSLREKFLTQFHNVNATLNYFKYLSRYLDSSLSQQLEASAYQISSFAFFTLIQEIDLGPSSRILIAYRLDHQDKDFSHSMVIWTSVSHCTYAEKCCHVDYSYWVRVKKSGIAMVDSDAEVGRYFPIRDVSQSVPGQEFTIWTNATIARPEWCLESGRGETIIASFAETGRLEVFLKIQNSPTFSDIRTFRDGHLYAVAAFYYDKRSDEFSSTIIFTFNELRREWTEHQILPSFGILSLDVTTYRSDTFVDEILLALGTGMGSYPDSYSSVYKWNDTQRAFKLIQDIPSQYVTSTLWVKKDFIQLLLLAGVDHLPASDAECLLLSGGQIDVYVYDGKLRWIQSIPLGGVASMVTFSVEGDVFVAAASSHLQSIVIFQWQGYAGFTQIQTFFVQDIRHMTAYWIESELYLAVSSASGPAKIFRAVTRGKHLTISDKFKPLVPEQKDQPPLDQKFISGC